ncbi:hypothetical protein RKE29_01455 [Streptomyces sp. B1866]|uniref:hypothetical protein n=1 Tax=Streptomyces sp. B1866 TaxID=3075431 RepID=UPI0028926C3E|nr:hypothetical protein [Streptomyces sp. B1866]MDT3395326.1 hypothetical protein [Streptomyces sp. B1866]
MTPPPPTADDARTMYLLAGEFAAARRHLDQSRRTPGGLPTLASAAYQLHYLGQVFSDLTGEVVLRGSHTGPGATGQERQTVATLAAAAAPAARALEHFAEAYHQIGVLCLYADTPDDPELTDLRQRAVHVISGRLDQARTELRETSAVLTRAADRSGIRSARTTAARTRSALAHPSGATASSSDAPARAPHGPDTPPRRSR